MLVTFTEVSAEITSQKGTKYFNAKTSDGKSGATFFKPDLNVPTEVNERQKDYNGTKQYSWDKPKAGASQFAPGFKANPYATKIAALNSAIAYGSTRPVVSQDDTIKLADRFFAWIKAE